MNRATPLFPPLPRGDERGVIRHAISGTALDVEARLRPANRDPTFEKVVHWSVTLRTAICSSLTHYAAAVLLCRPRKNTIVPAVNSSSVMPIAAHSETVGIPVTFCSATPIFNVPVTPVPGIKD